MTHSLSIPIAETSQVGEARRSAVRLADSVGMNEVRRAELAIVASELGTNLAKYGRDGYLFMQTLSPGTGPCVELVSVDHGPGIHDVQRCLQDGYSTGGSPGTGLGAVRRLSNEFDLYSTPAGTVVVSRLPVQPPAAPQSQFQWGAVSSPAPRELVCGDTWRVVEREGEIAVMVADGLGHGPLAAEAARLAADSFEEDVFAGPGAFCERAHRALNGSRGAAIAAAQASSPGGLRYAGVGNISGSLVSHDHSRGMFSQNGTAGLQMRRAQQMDYAWPEHAILIMHSDGVTNRWSVAAYEGLFSRHPAVIAAILHRDHLRGRDDATIVVVRVRPRAPRPAVS
jgi:anti-sigma regulatory factor (Ser/Thr protein kinase)